MDELTATEWNEGSPVQGGGSLFQRFFNVCYIIIYFIAWSWLGMNVTLIYLLSSKGIGIMLASYACIFPMGGQSQTAMFSSALFPYE